jgi:hypothetical protein
MANFPRLGTHARSSVLVLNGLLLTVILVTCRGIFSTADGFTEGVPGIGPLIGICLSVSEALLITCSISLAGLAIVTWQFEQSIQQQRWEVWVAETDASVKRLLENTPATAAEVKKLMDSVPREPPAIYLPPDESAGQRPFEHVGLLREWVYPGAESGHMIETAIKLAFHVYKELGNSHIENCLLGQTAHDGKWMYRDFLGLAPGYPKAKGPNSPRWSSQESNQPARPGESSHEQGQWTGVVRIWASQNVGYLLLLYHRLRGPPCPAAFNRGSLLLRHARVHRHCDAHPAPAATEPAIRALGSQLMFLLGGVAFSALIAVVNRGPAHYLAAFLAASSWSVRGLSSQVSVLPSTGLGCPVV